MRNCEDCGNFRECKVRRAISLAIDQSYVRDVENVKRDVLDRVGGACELFSVVTARQREAIDF